VAYFRLTSLCVAAGVTSYATVACRSFCVPTLKPDYSHKKVSAAWSSACSVTRRVQSTQTICQPKSQPKTCTQATMAGLNDELQSNRELADELNMDEADLQRLQQDVDSVNANELRCNPPDIREMETTRSDGRRETVTFWHEEGVQVAWQLTEGQREAYELLKDAGSKQLLAFLSGEGGMGKSLLVHTHAAQAAHPTLSCQALAISCERLAIHYRSASSIPRVFRYACWCSGGARRERRFS